MLKFNKKNKKTRNMPKPKPLLLKKPLSKILKSLPSLEYHLFSNKLISIFKKEERTGLLNITRQKKPSFSYWARIKNDKSIETRRITKKEYQKMKRYFKLLKNWLISTKC